MELSSFSYRRIFFGLWLYVGLLVLSQLVRAQPAIPTDLMAKAMSMDKVPIIVRLAVPTSPEGVLNQAQVEQQRQGIKILQDQVLATMDSQGLAKTKAYLRLPFMALHVDANNLQKLANNSAVAAIYEDKLSVPSLQDSTELIGAVAATAQGFDGSGQVVAIVDTGVDRTHPFFTNKIVAEACFSTTFAAQGAVSVCPNGADQQLGVGSGVNCPNNLSGCDHGSHVAGIAAGSGNDFSGVAAGANIIALQVFSRFDSVDICNPAPAPCILSFTSDQISALEFVFNQRNTFVIASVNMSLGGGRFDSVCDNEPQRLAIDLLRSEGIATVVAAGNNGFPNAISSPACISNAISVGATSKTDGVATFSNRSANLDLFAPGVSIRSSVPGNGFSVFNGTSMAAPHVAGAFAVLRSKQSDASVESLLGVLKNNAPLIVDNVSGLSRPRINLQQALAALDGTISEGIMEITPASDFAAIGSVGGPFQPATMSYSVSNIGNTSINFSVTENISWLNVTPNTGSLAANESAEIAFSVTANAATLATGEYNGEVQFSNLTNGRGNSNQAVKLTVVAEEVVNDKFANAIVLPQSSGATTGFNNGAGKEEGEPNHANNNGGASVWWQLSVPANGQITVSTAGSDFNTLLAVYTGVVISNLTMISENDDRDANVTSSEVIFTARAGENYFIAVDGFNAAVGTIQLEWSFSPDQVAPGELSVTPDEGFSISGLQGGPFSPMTKTYLLTNTGSSEKAFTVQDLPLWLNVSQSNGTVAPGAEVAIQLSVNTAANSLPPGQQSATVMFNAVAREVDIEITPVASLSNDDFANAILLVGEDINTMGFNIGASKEFFEQANPLIFLHGGRPGERSVWWRWVAPSSGHFIADLQGSQFDTTLGVYQFIDEQSVARPVSNDDAPQGLQSIGAFQATAGTTYHIAVDGYFSATGNIALSIEPLTAKPVNDDFIQATPITASAGTITGSNNLASSENFEPSHASDFMGGHSVWWRFQLTAPGTVSLNTFGSDFDTTLAVYVGPTVDDLTVIASNDDANSDLQSGLSFSGQANVDYFIAVDGFFGLVGNITLNFNLPNNGMGANELLIDDFD